MLLWLHNHVWCNRGRNGIGVELRDLVMLLDLLALSFYVHAMLKLSGIGLQIGRAVGTQFKGHIVAAHTDRAMTLGTEMKFMPNLSPGGLQRRSLLGMPLGTVELFTLLGSASPESSEETHTNIHNVGGCADR